MLGSSRDPKAPPPSSRSVIDIIDTFGHLRRVFGAFCTFYELSMNWEDGWIQYGVRKRLTDNIILVIIILYFKKRKEVNLNTLFKMKFQKQQF